MTTTDEARRVLSFGLNEAIPPTAPAAWGCRAIVTQDGDVDVLPDRQDLFGEEPGRRALVAWLNGGSERTRPFLRWKAAAARLLRAYEMQTREGGQHILYEDTRGVIVGDTHGSAGYLYVAAWLKAAPVPAPVPEPVCKTCHRPADAPAHK